MQKVLKPYGSQNGETIFHEVMAQIIPEAVMIIILFRKHEYEASFNVLLFKHGVIRSVCKNSEKDIPNSNLDSILKCYSGFYIIVGGSYANCVN